MYFYSKMSCQSPAIRSRNLVLIQVILNLVGDPEYVRPV
eukprot:SAG31_NODE_33183_length_347_cov_0.423387_1_plen_38_part_10